MFLLFARSAIRKQKYHIEAARMRTFSISCENASKYLKLALGALRIFRLRFCSANCVLNITPSFIPRELSVAWREYR